MRGLSRCRFSHAEASLCQHFHILFKSMQSLMPRVSCMDSQKPVTNNLSLSKQLAINRPCCRDTAAPVPTQIARRRRLCGERGRRRGAPRRHARRGRRRGRACPRPAYLHRRRALQRAVEAAGRQGARGRVVCHLAARHGRQRQHRHRPARAAVLDALRGAALRPPQRRRRESLPDGCACRSRAARPSASESAMQTAVTSSSPR